MDVIVTGGTGFVGTHLCRELHDRGHDVTALSRTPDETPEGLDLPEEVDRVAGDVTAYDSIVDAFEGRDAVINLVALSPLFKPSGGEGRHREVHLGGTQNAVRAAEEHGVDRFVQQSALEADPNASNAYLRAKGEAEEVVRNSDLGWTIVRPSIIFGEGAEILSFTRMVTPPYLAPLPGGGKTRFQLIWIEEFAPILAMAAEDDEHVGQVYEIGGPEVQTLAEIAKLIRRADGYPVTVLPVPMSLTRIAFGVGGAIPGFPFGTGQYHGLRIDNTVAHNDVEAFGIDPAELTTLAAYLGLDDGSNDGAEPATVASEGA